MKKMGIKNIAIIILSALIVFLSCVVLRMAVIYPPEVDKTFEFCKMLVQQQNRGYKDTNIFAGCFEVFSGKKIILD